MIRVLLERVTPTVRKVLFADNPLVSGLSAPLNQHESRVLRDTKTWRRAVGTDVTSFLSTSQYAQQSQSGQLNDFLPPVEIINN